VLASGTFLKLMVPVTFKSAFAGTTDLWLYASGRAGNSDWAKFATWTIPAPVIIQAGPVDAVSVAPNSGTGLAQTFTLTFSDTAGGTDLNTAWFWITPSFTGSAAKTCFGYYDRIAGQFKLLNDSGTVWSTAVPGAAPAMQNGQCSFDASLAAAVNGTTLTLTLPVHFDPTFAGPKEIWTFASGRAGSSEWKKLATWTVQ
jgi:hypothetical protein